MTVQEQRDAALVVANDKRIRVAALRQRLRDEEAALEDVLRSQPEELSDWPLVDVVRLGWNRRAPKAMQHLGRMAVRDNINLMVPLGCASLRSREWLIDHACWHWVACRGRARHYILVEDAA